MSRQKTISETNTKKKVEEISDLLVKRDKVLNSVISFQEKIEKLEEEIVEINKRLSTLVATNDNDLTANQHESTNQITTFPKKGRVFQMAHVMSETVPMTLDDIIEALKKNGETKVSRNSIRSYLSNDPCFKNLKKGERGNNIKGWVCVMDKVGQKY